MKRRTVLLVLLPACVIVGVVVAVRAPGNDGRAESGAGGSEGRRREPPRLVGRGDAEAVTASAEDAGPVAEQAVESSPWILSAHVVTAPLDEYPRTADESRPVRGATVRVWLVLGDVPEEVGKGETGPNGNASIDLRGLAAMSRSQLGRARLVGQASAPGHCPSRMRWFRSIVHLLGEGLEPVPWVMEFELTPGPVVVGRVITGDGRPVPYVAVLLEALEGGPLLGEQLRRACGPCDMDGRYAIPVPRPARFRARVGWEEAESCTAPFLVAEAGDTEAPTLRLRARPTTRGVVRFTDGTPVADLAFEIDNWRFYDGSHFVVPEEEDWPHSHDMGSVVTTDSAGMFRVELLEGLDAEEMAGYYVRIPGVDSESTGFDASAPTLSVTIPLHRLRVRLRDGRDEPLRGQRVTLYLEGGETEGIRGLTDADGEVSLFAPRGSRGLLRLVSAGNAVHARQVEIPQDENESIVRLAVPDRQASGVLAFHADVEPEQLRSRGRLIIRTPDGHVVVRRDLEVASDCETMPPGVYVVELSVVPAQSLGEDVPDIWAPLDTAKPVVVREGETVTVDARWTDTSALALFVRVAGLERTLLPDGRAWLEDAAGGRRELLLHDRWNEAIKGLAVGQWLCEGSRLPPGPYRLVLEADGYRPVQRDVTLLDRQLTRVEVELEREP